MVMMFFSKLSKVERIGLVVAAFVIIAVFVDRLVVNPLGVKLRRMNKEIALSEKKLAYDLRNIQNRDLIEGEYKKHKDFVKKSAVSDEEDVSNMLAEIEALARSAGVDLVDIKPLAPRQVDFYKEYSAEVTIEGGMEHIVTFLHQLNGSPQLLRAVKLRLGVKQKDSPGLKATLLVTNVTL